MDKIKLNVLENDRIIDTIENVTYTDPVHLLESLEAFRQLVNEKLTQKIEDDGNFEDLYIEEESNSSEDEDIPVSNSSPKKRKT